MDEEDAQTLWSGLADAYQEVKRLPDGPTFDDYAGPEGLAVRWSELLKEKAKIAAETDEIAGLAQPLWLQSQTWALLATLSNCRHPEEDVGPTAAELLRSNPYVTPMELTAAITAHDVELDEWIAIREVLHETSPYSALNQPPPSSDTGTYSFLPKATSGRYLPATHAEVRSKSNLFSGSNGGPSRAGPSNDDGPSRIAGCLDLDCDVREAGVRLGGRLMPDDKAARQDLLAQLFTLVRTGRVDEAGDICKKSNESWRAASLEAASPWRVSSSGETDGMNVEGGMKTFGSLNRSLWKNACSAIARNPRLSDHERALYGAISGDLQSVLPVCKTWDDHLWAHVNSLIETRLSDNLEQLGGYWQNEFGVRSSLAGGLADVEEERTIRASTMEQAFMQLSKTDKDGVAEQAMEPYQVAQQRIVLDQFDYLVEEFAEKLSAVREEMETNQGDLIIGFFVHLILYLRGIEHDVPSQAADDIIKAYIDILNANEQKHLIALYASELTDESSGGNAEYAKFLKGLPSSTTRDERREALSRAEEQGLDIYVIANLVTQETVKMVLYRMEGSIENYNDAWQHSDAISKSEADIIRSLEWTTFATGSYPDALIAANTFLRSFWCTRRFSAAACLFQSLPEDFAEVCRTHDNLSENEYLEFVLHSDLKRAVDTSRKAKQVWEADLDVMMPKALKGELMAYTNEHGPSVTAAHEAAISLLSGGWSNFVCTGGSGSRNKAWTTLRKVYTPSLVFDLHALLIRSSIHKPHNLQSAIDLPQIIAAKDDNGESPVLGNMGKRNMIAYLKEAEAASMLALSRGSQDPLTAI